MRKRTDMHGFYSDKEKLCKVLVKLSQTVKQDKTHSSETGRTLPDTVYIPLIRGILKKRKNLYL